MKMSIELNKREMDAIVKATECVNLFKPYEEENFDVKYAVGKTQVTEEKASSEFEIKTEFVLDVIDFVKPIYDKAIGLYDYFIDSFKQLTKKWEPSVDDIDNPFLKQKAEGVKYVVKIKIKETDEERLYFIKDICEMNNFIETINKETEEFEDVQSIDKYVIEYK